MSSPYKLTPTTGQVIAYTHSDAQAPYIEAWYQRKKLEGETLPGFICRMSVVTALLDRQNWSREQVQATKSTTDAAAQSLSDTDEGQVGTDHLDELAACGVA